MQRPQPVPEFPRVIIEFVRQPLPPAAGLVGTRVVSRGMQGEQGKRARVPILLPHARATMDFILQVKAVARRADIRAGAAAQARPRRPFPQRVAETPPQPFRRRLGVETHRNFLADSLTDGLQIHRLTRRVQPRHQLASGLGVGFGGERSVRQFGQHHVRAVFAGGIHADGGAEARGIRRFPAGERDKRHLFQAPLKKWIMKIPAEQRGQDLRRGGIAGARAKHDDLGEIHWRILHGPFAVLPLEFQNRLRARKPGWFRALPRNALAQAGGFGGLGGQFAIFDLPAVRHRGQHAPARSQQAGRPLFHYCSRQFHKMKSS